jgi:hypothetical protein
MVGLNLAGKGAAALVFCAALASTGAQAATAPNGMSFAVTVSKNGGAPFNDCFSFATDGRLKVSGLNRYGPLVYADTTYGTDVSWLAVAPPAFVARYGAGFMFAGQVDANGNLVATGLSTPDSTYAITGTPTASCKAAARFGPDGWATRRKHRSPRARRGRRTGGAPDMARAREARSLSSRPLAAASTGRRRG